MKNKYLVGITVILGLLLIVALIAQAAQTLTFIWDANPVEEQITGYRLYQDCGSEECVIADIVNPATTTITVPAPEDRDNHSYSLTAYRIEPDGEITESYHSDYAIYAVQKTRPTKRTLHMTVNKV